MAISLEPAAPIDGAAIVPDDLVEQHIKPASSADAALISAFRLAAIDQLERFTGLSFQRRGWRMILDGFLPSIRLLRAPVATVTAMRYLDRSGTLQIATDWRLSGDTLVLGSAGAWPATLHGQGVVSIDFDAGFSNIGVQAPALQTAVLLMMRHLYDGGDDGEPKAVAALCRPYRTPVLA